MLFALVLLLVPLNRAYQALQLVQISKLQLLGCDVRYYAKSLKSVHGITCDHTGLRSVPENIPTSLFELELPNNAITVFPCTGLGRLYTLSLRNNSISYVVWKCLKNMPSLARLDLSYNQIFCVNLYPVRPFLASLRKLDLSYNRLKVIPLCDLGINVKSAKESHVHYEVAIEGNPFHCVCKMAWLADLAIAAAMCRGAPSLRCVNFFEQNSIAHEMFKNQSLFRCKTPPKLEDIELYRLNISKCYTWNETDRSYKLLHVPRTCPLDYPCPKTDTDHSQSNVTILTPLSSTSSSKYSPQTTSNTKLQEAKTREVEGTFSVTCATLTAVKKATTAFSHVKASVAMFTKSSAKEHEMTEVPQMTNMSSTTQSLDRTKDALVVNMTEMTQTQDMTGMTQALNMTQMNYTLDMHMTETPETPWPVITNLFHSLSITKMTQTLEMTKATNTPEMTETTKKLEMAETKKPSEMTETTKAPEMRETTLTLPTTELPKSHNKPSPQSAVMGSGWVMTIAVVAMIAVVCGAVFAVYWVMFRKQTGKNASRGHLSKMAAGQTVNISNQAPLSDQNTDSGLYETIPDTNDCDSAYAKSPYVFDIPQYHLSDIEMSEIFKARGTKVSTGQSKQEDQHVYDNKSVSDEMAPYATSYMADIFPSGKYV